MVMGDDSCSKGGGFESRRHILDGHLDIFSHCFVVKSVSIVCLKRSKINESGWGRPILSTNLIETYKWGYATCLFDYNF